MTSPQMPRQLNIPTRFIGNWALFEGWRRDEA